MASTSMQASKYFSTILLLLLLLHSSVSFLQVSAQGGDGGLNFDQPVDINSRSNITAKVWCLVILLVSSFSFGIFPYLFRSNESFLLLGTQFSGGIFLGTTLMHFLADSATTFPLLTTKTYPFAFMLASSGYVFTMLSYAIIIEVIKHGKKEKRVEVEEGKSAEGHEREIGSDLSTSIARWTGRWDTVLLVFALCLHAVFEGIDIGSSVVKDDAWRKLWRISLHKVLAAIAMDIALLRTLPKRPFLMTVSCSLAFAAMSPIGVGIGIALDKSDGMTVYWIYAISIGIVSGIVVYVSVNHLIAKGFKPQGPCYVDAPCYKFLAVLAGVAAIAVVMIWVS